MSENPSEHEKVEDLETPLYKPDRLISISVQAKTIAWVILAASILFLADFTIGFIKSIFSNPYAVRFDDLSYYFLGLFPALIGLFLYVLLRALAEGIFLFMDIETGLRELKEHGK